MFVYMRKLIFIILILGLFNYLNAQNKITVAVAANMQFPMKALKEKFENETGIKVDIILSSSGKLTQQIQEGAPYDVFISADTSYPQTLYRKGFAPTAPQVYAKGVLVLWTMNTNITPSKDLKILLNKNVKKIAAANPKIAPYGVAAEQVLKSYNIYDQVKTKLVFGESITQTNQFITSQSADIGFTAKSVVLSDEMKNKGTWIELNHDDYPPILQAAVLLKYGIENNSSAARKFYDFLFSATAKDIYKKYGYLN